MKSGSRWARVRAALLSQRAGAVVFSLGALFFASLAWSDIDDNAKLGPDSPVATGQIIEVHDGRNSSVVIEFRTRSGESVRADVANYLWKPRPEVGDEARVSYNPEDPEYYVRDVRMGDDWVIVAISSTTAVALSIGAIMAWSRRLPDWILHHNR